MNKTMRNMVNRSKFEDPDLLLFLEIYHNCVETSIKSNNRNIMVMGLENTIDKIKHGQELYLKNNTLELSIGYSIMSEDLLNKYKNLFKLSSDVSVLVVPTNWGLLNNINN